MVIKIMNVLKIYLSPASYIYDGRVSDFGKIHIKVGECSFPEREWTDFGRIIVFWWMDAFSKLLTGEEKEVQCKFMDGNFRFDVKSISKQLWHVSLIKEKAESEEIQYEDEISVEQATSELLHIIAEFKSMFQKAGNVDFVSKIDNLTHEFNITRSKNLGITI